MSGGSAKFYHRNIAGEVGAPQAIFTTIKQALLANAFILTCRLVEHWNPLGVFPVGFLVDELLSVCYKMFSKCLLL